jgi:hypothetical protein
LSGKSKLSFLIFITNLSILNIIKLLYEIQANKRCNKIITIASRKNLFIITNDTSNKGARGIR